MPLLNGFGTSHHGKKNTVSTTAFCGHCGRFGHLSSYDTRTYVVLMFFPLIPLSKLRILRHCPACNKATEMKHDKWSAVCTEVQSNAREVVQTRLQDPEAVIEAANQVSGIQDRAAFDAIAGRIAQVHGTNPRVLNAVADGYVGFGHAEIAEKCYMASLKAADSKEAREGLAYTRLLQHRATEAAPLLAHLLQQPDPRRSFLLYLLAQGLQAEGKHDEAIALVETTLARYPELINEKAWKRLWKTAQKHKGSTKPLGKAALVPYGKPGRDISSARMVAGMVVLAVLVIGMFMLIAWGDASYRAVHLVNGLSRGYQVSIDGKPYDLLPNEVMEIEVGEGTHTVEATGLRLPEEAVTIRTNFWTRAFREEVFAINPDRVAVLVWEKTEYSDEAEAGKGDYEYAIHTNELLHEFPHVHYIFEEFPDEIRTKANKEMKTRVGVVPVEPETLIEMLEEELDETALLTQLKRRFHYTPNNTIYLQTLAGLLGPEGFLAEIAPELKARPIKIEVHRHYQQIQEAVHPEHDLEAEYIQLLATDPDNADLIYLTGRAARDPDQADTLMTRAANGGSAHGWGALAFSALANGAFEDGMQRIEQALTLAPDNVNFQHTRGLLWLATKSYDRYFDSLPKNAAGLPLDFSTLDLAVHIMGTRGDSPQAASEYIEKTLKHFERTDGPIPGEYRETAKTFLMGIHACAYELGLCTEATEKSDGDRDRVIAKLLRGDIRAAADAAKDSEVDGATHASIYLLAKEQGLDDLAETHLAEFVTVLQESGDRESREVAEALSGTGPVSADPLLRMVLQPDAKRVALAVLAAKFPDDRQRYLALARTLNFQRSHPYFILDAYLTRAGA